MRTSEGCCRRHQRTHARVEEEEAKTDNRVCCGCELLTHVRPKSKCRTKINSHRKKDNPHRYLFRVSFARLYTGRRHTGPCGSGLTFFRFLRHIYRRTPLDIVDQALRFVICTGPTPLDRGSGPVGWGGEQVRITAAGLVAKTAGLSWLHFLSPSALPQKHATRRSYKDRRSSCTSWHSGCSCRSSPTPCSSRTK